MTDLHWELRDYLDEFRPDGRLNVFLCILMHKNMRNRSYPSNDTIRSETGFSLAPISASIKWLLDNHAMVLVPYDKRVGNEKRMGKNKNIYQLTGVIFLRGAYRQYWSLNPEGWEAVEADLAELGDNLLSELSSNSDNSLGKYLLSKRKGIKESNAFEGITTKSPATSAGLEQAEPQTKSKKKPAPSKPSNQPAVKPTETKVAKSRKKQTPLQAALEAMKPYRELIHEMALLCKAGYADSMGDPEHSLTVKELQSYTEAAEDYFRLGGKLDQVQGLYKYVDNQNKQRTWKIAPSTLVKGIAGYQSQIAITAKRNASQQRNSPTGTTPVPPQTEAERQETLRLIREGRKLLQETKQT